MFFNVYVVFTFDEFGENMCLIGVFPSDQASISASQSRVAEWLKLYRREQDKVVWQLAPLGDVLPPHTI